MTKEPAISHLEASIAGDSNAVLADAAKLLAKRGMKFTTIRRSVLELLCREQRAVGAYELASSFMAEYGRPIVPNTVYRALEFLEEQGLAVHLMSTRAYVLNRFRKKTMPNVFFVCMSCKAISEMNDPQVEQAKHGAAKKIRFKASPRPIEIQGTCTQCAE